MHGTGIRAKSTGQAGGRGPTRRPGNSRIRSWMVHRGAGSCQVGVGNWGIAGGSSGQQSLPMAWLSSSSRRDPTGRHMLGAIPPKCPWANQGGGCGESQPK